MGINATFFLSFALILIGLSGCYAVAFFPLDWKADAATINAAQSFAKFFVFGALIGGLVVGLYKATVLMVRHL